jgi:hypothetical protein
VERGAVRAIVLAIALAGAAAPAAALAETGSPASAAPPAPPAAAPSSSPTRPTSAATWGDGRGATPASEPARGEPYNLRQMGYAAVIMLGMLGFVVWLIRRHPGRRDRDGAPPR